MCAFLSLSLSLSLSVSLSLERTHSFALSLPLAGTVLKAPLYYKACMDEELRNAESKAALQEVLDAFAAQQGVEDQLSSLALQDVSAFMSIGVGADDKNSTRNNLFLSQAGLGLPDRDYYINKTVDTDAILAAYSRYIDASMAMLNLPQAGDAVVALETELAGIFIPNDQLKDPEDRYNPFTVARLQQSYGFINWAAFLAGIYPDNTPTSLVVTTPAYFQRLTGESERGGGACACVHVYVCVCMCVCMCVCVCACVSLSLSLYVCVYVCVCVCACYPCVSRCTV